MPLTVQEMNQLVKLKEKAAMVSNPLSDDEIIAIEKRIADTYSSMHVLMKDMMIPWNKYCEILKAISTDNSVLLSEVNRLKGISDTDN